MKVLLGKNTLRSSIPIDFITLQNGILCIKFDIIIHKYNYILCLLKGLYRRSAEISSAQEDEINAKIKTRKGQTCGIKYYLKSK